MPRLITVHVNRVGDWIHGVLGFPRVGTQELIHYREGREGRKEGKLRTRGLGRTDLFGEALRRRRVGSWSGTMFIVERPVGTSMIACTVRLMLLYGQDVFRESMLPQLGFRSNLNLANGSGIWRGTP